MASESNLESLKDQYEIAVAQADEANGAVQANAMRVQELAAERMQLLGQIQQAKMQEEVNKAVEAMSGALEHDTPSLERVEKWHKPREIGDRIGSLLQTNFKLTLHMDLVTDSRDPPLHTQLCRMRVQYGPE